MLSRDAPRKAQRFFYFKEMAKDSYWFRHDSSAGRGTRMRKIAFVYGHWGKGIYWDVIEMLRDQANYKYPSAEFDLKMLADLIGCKDETKFINWFNDCIKYELFQVDNGMFFSQVLCDNMKRWEASKGNGSKGGRPDQEKPKPKPRNNLTDNLTTNLNETIIEENSIVEDRIEEKKTVDNIPPFEIFSSYAIGKKPKVCLEALERKYNTWVELGWKTGLDKEIKNWKVTLINTLPYLPDRKIVYTNPTAGNI